ncbi:MAG: tyrosine protein phosphatase [Desulfobacterales bacterium]|nr:tyrosine protein phosphatase [Desulfobacterales bacterium]
MIDLHCHILHGIDDGPKTIEESLSMAKIAALDGIRTIVATPHTLDGVYLNSFDKINSEIEKFKQAILKEKVDIKLCIGADVHLCPHMIDKIKDKSAITINNGMRYMLLEFPSMGIPEEAKNEIFSLKVSGITPIITHPERHLIIQKKPDILKKLIKMGALCQITASSITGGFGESVKQFTKKLLQNRMVHIIATDAHSSNHRRPILSLAVEAASKILKSSKEAEAMVTTFPSAVIEGKSLDIY